MFFALGATWCHAISVPAQATYEWNFLQCEVDPIPNHGNYFRTEKKAEEALKMCWQEYLAKDVVDFYGNRRHHTDFVWLGAQGPWQRNSDSGAQRPFKFTFTTYWYNVNGTVDGPQYSAGTYYIQKWYECPCGGFDPILDPNGVGGPELTTPTCSRSLQSECKDGYCGNDTPNPINSGNGTKSHFENLSVASSVRFTGYYSSRIESASYTGSSTIVTDSSVLGESWRHSFGASLNVLSNALGTGVYAYRSDRVLPLVFQQSGGAFIAEGDSLYMLSAVTNGYALRTPDDTVERYDIDGRLQSITARSGVVQALAYNAAGQVVAVTDSYGRSLSFVYNPVDLSNGVGTLQSEFEFPPIKRTLL
jgi:YD repeat-containing protein